MFHARRVWKLFFLNFILEKEFRDVKNNFDDLAVYTGGTVFKREVLVIEPSI